MAKRVNFQTTEVVRRTYTIIVDDGVTFGDVASAQGDEWYDLTEDAEEVEIIEGDEEVVPGTWREVTI
jgi:hypothetical protein